MTVTPAFKWTLAALTILTLAALAADRVGWIDRLLTSPQHIETTIEATHTNELMAQLLTYMESVIPRLFPETTELSKAIKNYEKSKNLSQRTELAYDLIALKFRNDLQANQLSKEQEEAYQNATSLLNWSMDLLAFYLAKIPNNKMGSIEVKFGSFRQTLRPEMAKRILVATFSPKNDQCSDQQFEDLRENFQDDFLAMNLTNLMRTFLILEKHISRQLMAEVKTPLISSVQNTSHREVIESVYKIRSTAEGGINKESEIETLNMFFSSKNRDLVFNIFLSAPGCFKSPGVMAFLKRVQRLQSKVRANFYLGLVRAYFKRFHRAPDDLDELRIENPQNEREKFYRRPSDGWGHPFEMIVEGNRIQLISIGQDRKPGTEDDFVAAEGDLNETM